MKVLLTCDFIFNNDEIWSSFNEYVKDIGEFFDERGFDVEMVKPAGEENKKAIFIITKAEEAQILPTQVHVNPVVKFNAPKEGKR